MAAKTLLREPAKAKTSAITAPSQAELKPKRLRPARSALPAGFLPLQHPQLVTKAPAGPEWVSEIKYDGYRMQLRVTRGRATWWSRNGNDWSERFADFAEGLAAFPDCILDGEMCVVDAKGRPDFSALRACMGHRQAGKMDKKLTFFVFDLLALKGKDLRAKPLRERRSLLEGLVDPEAGAVGGRFIVVQEVPGPAEQLIQAACAMQLEGIVCKRLDAPYVGGDTRPDTWRKLKCRPVQELVIAGWRTEGSAFKGLLTGVYEHGLLVYAGTLHNGFTPATFDPLMRRLRELKVARSPFSGTVQPQKRRDQLHYVRPELVARAEIAEWTAGGKLRQASFKGLREDKDPREVVREG